MNGTDVIRIAERLMAMRDGVRVLFGADYEQRLEPWRQAVVEIAAKNSTSLIQAFIDGAQSLRLQDQPIEFLAAATVEEIEAGGLEDLLFPVDDG